jgi:acyl-CoA synthetase (NDP forming)
VYPTPERAVKALEVLYEYGKVLKRDEQPVKVVNKKK